MEFGNVTQFLENRTILVTGAAGFLAKIFVEKILRVQPNVKKLYLLLRAADAKSASQRLHNEVMAKELFSVLREKLGSNFNSLVSEKVIPVAGDISCENLGVKDTNLVEEMRREVDIVVNLAATTNFDERYDVALGVNTLGATHVLNFAKKCANIKLLLHVSTAYVSGETAGLIVERPYHMGETLNGAPAALDIDTEKKVVEERLSELQAEEATEEVITMAMKDLGIQRARKHGWPNTYVFTKVMAEMVLGHLKENLPVIILRPTIISSTFKDPFPGWVEGLRTIDSLAIGYAKGKLKCFLGEPESIADVIPADMVVNAMIVAMVAHANQPSEMIYQVGSSIANPVRFSSLQEYGRRYFTEHPWVGKDGKPVKVGKVTVLSSMASFRRYMTFRYLLPLQGLKIVNTALCQYYQDKYVDLDRKIKFVMRLIDIYEPYLFFKGIYDDTNTENLRMAAKEGGVDTDAFNFDPRVIDWEEFVMNTHIPGVVKYVFKA